MATFQAIELAKNSINEEITAEVSQYSISLRTRLGNIANFKADFDQAFHGFVENQLPKDELWKQIEN